MAHTEFTPRLSKRACLLAKNQVWKADDGTLMGGPELLGRMYPRGVDVAFFVHSKVGTVLKTGVSAWERTADHRTIRVEEPDNRPAARQTGGAK